MADIPHTIRAAVLNRANGRCEWCGRWTQGLNLHHRLFRSRRIRLDGGSIHDGDNLVALCGSGNHTGCHGKAHGAIEGGYDAAVAAGMTIPSGGSPAATPIRSVWFRLDAWLLPNGDFVFEPSHAVDPTTVPTLTPGKAEGPESEDPGPSAHPHLGSETRDAV